MQTGPEGVLSDVLSSVGEDGEYQVDSSILLNGVFGSEEELKAWAEEHGLGYEMSDLPGQTVGGKKMVNFYRRGAAE
ncbi:MAG TPA: hypothetical protein VF668_00420 [Pyrinomonadaceae bacterium]|jgi:hypothetical protein